MSDDLLRAALRERIDQLELPEVIVVDRFVSALLAPVEHTLAAGSWLSVKAQPTTCPPTSGTLMLIPTRTFITFLLRIVLRGR